MNTKEYAIMYPCDYTCDLIPELGESFGIPIDEELLEMAILEEDDLSPKNIVCFYDVNDKNNLLVAACLNGEGFHYVLARCIDSRSEEIKRKLLEVDTRMRMQGKQKILSDLTDYTNIPEHGLSRLTKVFGVEFV